MSTKHRTDLVVGSSVFVTLLPSGHRVVGKITERHEDHYKILLKDGTTREVLFSNEEHRVVPIA